MWRGEKNEIKINATLASLIIRVLPMKLYDHTAYHLLVHYIHIQFKTSLFLSQSSFAWLCICDVGVRCITRYDKNSGEKILPPYRILFYIIIHISIHLSASWTRSNDSPRVEYFHIGFNTAIFKHRLFPSSQLLHSLTSQISPLRSKYK